MQAGQLDISAIPAFQDNYIWLLTGGGTSCAVVDPGDEEPVLEELEKRGLDLRYILLTHHHPDHTGGVLDLLDHFDAEVFGPDDKRIPCKQHICSEGDLVSLPDINVKFKVLEVPAHTNSHIAFYGGAVNDAVALFCGDTLFSIGCGRLFEGTPADMQLSLDKLAALPAETLVYCAHEYTQSNCAFAMEVEPANAALRARSAEVNALRAAGRITLPSTIGGELASNPFLRTRESDVLEAARKLDPEVTAGTGVMAVIRAWKDRY